MDASELPAYLEAIAARADLAAVPAAVDMATTYQTRVRRNLALSSHAPFTRTPSPPGFFPSRISGNLGRHILMSGAGGSAGLGFASISAETIYAAVQEYGGSMSARSRKYMHFFWSGEHFRKHVTVLARPYMRPTTAIVIADGSLSRAAMRAFDITVWA
jgi:phage gpG-like protein